MEHIIVAERPHCVCKSQVTSFSQVMFTASQTFGTLEPQGYLNLPLPLYFLEENTKVSGDQNTKSELISIKF
jgi:hypothetical protein